MNGYDVDLLPVCTDIADDLKKDLLGARRKILFVEGTERSLDKPLYGQVFPTVTVIEKSTCRDVEHAVRAVRDTSGLHWVKPFGITDGDGREVEETNELRSTGIYAVPGYSVESVYYHPEIQRRVAERHSTCIGGNAQERLHEAKSQAILTISQHIERLSVRVAEKKIRAVLLKQMPKQGQITAGLPIQLSANPGSVVTAEKARLQNLVMDQDLLSIINRYPIRETGALNDIANRLGFQSRKQYENAVLTLLHDDESSRRFERSLFNDLASDIDDA